MKKTLNPSAISNELKGSSAFFRSSSQPPLSTPLTPTSLPPSAVFEQHIPSEEQRAPSVVSQYRDTMVATTSPRPPESISETTRKALKQVGKEAATYRFTAEEKRALGDVVYKYKRRGIRTSDNEITRISINYLLEEHRRLGDQSILAQIIALLNG